MQRVHEIDPRELSRTLRFDQRELRTRDVCLLLILISDGSRTGIHVSLDLLRECLLGRETLATHPHLLLLLDQRQKIRRHREHDRFARAREVEIAGVTFERRLAQACGIRKTVEQRDAGVQSETRGARSLVDDTALVLIKAAPEVLRAGSAEAQVRHELHAGLAHRYF